MAQLTTRQVTIPTHPIPTTPAVLIPGLSVSIFTGAGNIRAALAATVINSAAGVATVTFTLRLDGVALAANTGGILQDTFLNAYYRSMHKEWVMRVGAGQHTFEIFGLTSTALPTIYLQDAYFSVWELGF